MAAIFPGAVATQLQLLTAQNNSMVVLDADCDLDDDVITIDDASALPNSGYLTFVDTDEVIYYSSKTSNTLTGVTRGADGTTAAAHLAGVDIEQRWNADYHNILTLEFVAVEQFISDKIGLSTTQIVAPAGSVSAPAYTTLGDLDTGLYHSGANTLDIATGGTRAATWNSSQQLQIYKTSSQIILGTTNTVTISSTAPAASRVYTIPDAGGAANFLLSGWAQIVNADISASAAIAYSKLTLTGSIVNADVNASAAIAYSKLNLSGSIVNADINASAAIAYSKLALSGSIINADVSASAAIAYSKLSLTGSIVNADIGASAAIARSKLAALTASRVMVTDGSGFDSASSITTTTLAFLDATSSIQTQLDAKAALAGATFTGDIIVDNQHLVKFREGSGGGTNYFGIKASATMAADVTVLLPNAAPTANLQVLRVADYTTGQLEWGTGGGSGGINYISTNADAESGTTGWAAYADAAGTTPVDGTGGSPSVTITRTTSSPLRGTGMFTLTKDAANRQGNGASYDFTIDAADKATVLQISFDYQVSSAFVAGDSSDVRIFIYDVTNAVLITPAPYTIQGGNGTPHKFVSTFQTASNSTSYRLIFHVATTNASAWTMDFDNVIVGPQKSVWGAPVSDWTSFTMVVTGTTSNPAFGSWLNNNAQWRRVGDSMEILFEYQQTSAGSDGSGTYLWAIPTGYTMDTNKIVITNGANGGDDSRGICGVASTNDAVGSGNRTGYVKAYDSTHLMMMTGDQTTTPTRVSSTWGNLGGASRGFGFRALVPIVGWGSNVQMSNDTDTRVVFARYSTTAAPTMTANTDTIVNYATLEYDTHNAVTTGASWKFTAPVSGYYRVAAQVGMTNSYSAISGANANNLSLQLWKNGSLSTYLNYTTIQNTTSNSWRPMGSSTIFLNAGDYCDVRCRQDSGSNQTLSASAVINWITVERVSGPATIAATETVACRYSTDSGQSNAHVTVTIINYEDKDYDTHSAVTTGASWKFTAPISGTYRVDALMMFASASVTTGTNMFLDLYKNGSLWSRIAWMQPHASATIQVPLGGTDTIRLLPGDYIDVRVKQNTGGSVNLDSGAVNNHISITRIGNY